MFSQNGKISEKQLRRMLVLSVFASLIFVIPYVSANVFGNSILPGLITFFVLSSVYIICIYGLGAWYEKSRVTTGKEGFVSVLAESGLIGKTLAVIVFVRMVIRLAFYILLAITILSEAQVPFMRTTEGEIYSKLLVVLPLLLIALYGANTKVEKQGRIHEIIFWVLFIPFIIMILFGLKEVDYEVFIPRVNISFSKLLLYSYLLLTFVLPVENYLYLKPDLRKHKEKKHICVAVIFVILLSAVLTLFMLGIYGINGAASEPMITISIMRYIRLPFGVLERFDVLMIWFFMIGIFVLICGTLYFAGHILCKLGTDYCDKRRIWGLIVTLLLAVGIVVWIRDYDNGLLTFICYGAIMDVPLSLILPLLGIGVNKLYAKEMEEEE